MHCLLLARSSLVRPLDLWVPVLGAALPRKTSVVSSKTGTENDLLTVDLPNLRMVIFHSYVAVYQRAMGMNFFHIKLAFEKFLHFYWSILHVVDCHSAVFCSILLQTGPKMKNIWLNVSELNVTFPQTGIPKTQQIPKKELCKTLGF